MEISELAKASLDSENLHFGKICHRTLQNDGFRAGKSFSGLRNLHFGKICDVSELAEASPELETFISEKLALQ